MTRVINIRDNHSGEIYIGRAGHGRDGYWGNPVVREKTCQECGHVHFSKGSTLKCYEKYLRRRLRDDAEFLKRFKTLKGKTLVCFCKPNPCHGDVIIKVLEEIC